MSRVALVVNPASRAAAAAVAAVRGACADARLGAPLVVETTIEDPGPGQVRYALAQGALRVVVAGGDGTVRLIAGELAGVPEVVLGVIPVGTANLFARSAGLPVRDAAARDAAARLLAPAAEVAVTAPARATDLGTARLSDAEGTRSEHPFLVLAGLGHDAATLAAVRPRHKASVRWLAYFAPGLRRLAHPHHLLRLTLDGRPVDAGPLWSLLAVNAARLPVGARVVPGARLDDGVLHAVLVAPSGVRGWAHIAATGLGTVGRASTEETYPADHPALRYRSAREVLVQAPGPVLAQVDGDVVGGIVEARMTLQPGAVRVAR